MTTYMYMKQCYAISPWHYSESLRMRMAKGHQHNMCSSLPRFKVKHHSTTQLISTNKMCHKSLSRKCLLHTGAQCQQFNGGRKFGPTLCWTLGMTHCKSPNIKYRCLLPCLWIPLSAGVHGKCTIATMFGINRTVIGLVYMFFLVQFEIRNSALSIIVWCTRWP